MKNEQEKLFFKQSITKFGCRVKKNNTIYVVWHQDPSGKRVVFVTKSTDGGNTFSKPLNISKNPGASQEPKLALLLG